MSALVDMRNAGQLKYLPGVTVITGDPDIEKAILKDRIVAVGQCVPGDKRGKRFVTGCPPNNAYVVDAIIGGREKVKRMYAEESLEETEE
jgi:Ni,Fe-hydrogenase III small subunit